MASSTRAAPNPGAVNGMYVPKIEVELSGVVFPVFGSMSWTVSQVKKRDWATELRPAYVGITGDQREEVDRDQATSVVAGELQFTWAEVSDRQDLLPALRASQEKRIAQAVVSLESSKKKGPARGRVATGANNTTTRRRTMSDTENGAAEGGTATEVTLEPKLAVDGKTKLPTRGFMGSVRGEIERLQAEGRTDITEEEVLQAAEAKNPDVQNGARHMRYVARIMGVTLVKPAKGTGEGETAAEGGESEGEGEE